MKSLLGVSFVLVFMTSCLSEEEQRLARARAQIEKYDKEQFKDSLMNAMETELFNEQSALAGSYGPVAVKKVRIIKENGDRVLEATLQNKTGHKIDALIISWELRDAFDERVEMLNTGSTSEKVLKPYAKQVYYWDVDNSTRRAKAYVSQVHFTDSTTWKVDKIK